MALTAQEILNKARKLEDAGRRLEQLSRILAWSGTSTRQMEPSDFADLRINWNLGSAVLGYKEVQGALADRVRGMMPQLIRDVRLAAQTEVANLLQENPLP